MRLIKSCMILALLAGCGASGPGTSQQSFALAVSSEPIEIQAPTTIPVQIVVVGAEGAPVTITAPNLPAFASLSGSVLTLSPTFQDAGDHSLALTATAGQDTDTAELKLHITRVNTPPVWGPIPWMQNATRSIRETTGAVIRGTPYLHVALRDAEGDDMTLDAEVVPSGQPFSGVPTHSFQVHPIGDYLNGAYEEVFSPVTGLTAPGSYRFKLRVTDALGAVGPWGWVEFGAFSLEP